MRETATRYDYSDPADFEGIDETCRIDRTLHSLFGASKVAADIYAQEYGRYFGMRGGNFSRRLPDRARPIRASSCTGFFLICSRWRLSGKPYTVFGYKGKQVRDNIHSFDVVRAFEEFARNPRPGEVYNLGGGRANSVSMLEAIARIEALTGRKINWTYSEQARKGDHICYISNLAKLKSHYPGWSLTRSLDSILEEMVGCRARAQPESREREPERNDDYFFFTLPNRFADTSASSSAMPSRAGSARIPMRKSSLFGDEEGAAEVARELGRAMNRKWRGTRWARRCFPTCLTAPTAWPREGSAF